MSRSAHRIALALALAVALAGTLTGCAADRVAGPAVRVRLLGLDGTPFDPFAAGASAYVALFTRSDCPISNRYAPEVNRLAARFAPRGVAFLLVYVDPAETGEAIRRHIAEYGYAGLAVACDPRHELVRAVGARVTPEAAVFTKEGRLAYLGRVDDRFPAYGKARSAADRHDLEIALEQVLAGRAVELARTEATGCLIADLR